MADQKNRKAAEKVILDYLEMLMPGSENTAIYKQRFAEMSDKEFEEFMLAIDEERSVLTIIAPNFGTSMLSVERNFAVAEKLGHNFFQRIWMEDGEDVPRYLTPKAYLVVDLPLRRQAQLLEKKRSIPEDNKSIDDLTGQPTGKSKGSKLSYPEIQIMSAMRLKSNLSEMLKYRGGDVKGFNAMNAQINRTGGVSLDAIAPFAGTVKSTETLATILKAMHLDNTLT